MTLFEHPVVADGIAYDADTMIANSAMRCSIDRPMRSRKTYAGPASIGVGSGESPITIELGWRPRSWDD
jgi:hypothetical protein